MVRFVCVYAYILILNFRDGRHRVKLKKKKKMDLLRDLSYVSQEKNMIVV